VQSISGGFASACALFAEGFWGLAAGRAGDSVALPDGLAETFCASAADSLSLNCRTTQKNRKSNTIAIETQRFISLTSLSLLKDCYEKAHSAKASKS
jgi:hypothetical protein